jgi:serine/threonine protein kinase
MISAGTLIDQRYEIQRVLGVGSFGYVYKAWHKLLERWVAIKVLNSNVLEESDGAARFERECKAMNALQHKNIISVYGFGVWNGSPYMVMEFIEGESLHMLLAEKKPLEPKLAIGATLQLCDALSCAHANGIVHRDLKPSNLMFTRLDGKQCLKIIDFGLAKLMPGYGIAAQKLTETGCAVGTCHYMSPEQCIGNAEVDHRTDIYAAGCLLYEMLTGHPPFEAEETVSIMFQHVNSPPPRLSASLPTTVETDALQAVIDRAMAKEINTRYASADEMNKDLESIALGKTGTLARSVRAVKPLPTPFFTKQKLRKVIPFAVAAAVMSCAAMAYMTSLAPIEPPQNTTPHASAIYDQIFLEAVRLHRTPQKRNSEILLGQINLALRLDKEDHSLTQLQRYQLLREKEFALFPMNKNAQLIAACEQAIAITVPGEDKYVDYEHLARALELSGDLGGSRDLLIRMANDSSLKLPSANRKRTLVNLARVAMKQRDLKFADDTIKSITTDNLSASAAPGYYWNSGDVNFLLGRYPRAQKDYEVGIALIGAEDEPIFQNNIARCVLATKQKAQYPEMSARLKALFNRTDVPLTYNTLLHAITFAALTGDKPAAEHYLSGLKLSPLASNEIDELNSWDRKACRQALHDAGYNQIDQRLASEFGWSG